MARIHIGDTFQQTNIVQWIDDYRNIFEMLKPSEGIVEQNGRVSSQIEHKIAKFPHTVWNF